MTRLHPLSVPYRAANTAGRLAWILLIVGVSSTQAGFGPAAGAAIVVVGLGAALAYECVYYRRFTYEVTPDTIDICSGVVSRRTREIPIGRIQNVDISRNAVSRALSIAEVRLETAGGSGAEAQLRYVGEAEARRLQSEISRLKRGPDADEEGADEPAVKELFTLAPKELALLGLVSVDLRLLSFVTVLIPVVAPSLSRPDPLLGLTMAAPIVALGLVVLSAVAGGVYSVTNYYGFRLWRAGDELRYERGLVQRYSGTIPLAKVQSLAVEENLLARQLGYASLTVETAGYAPGEGGSQSAVPLAERERAFDLARSVEPFGDVDLDRPPKRARERYAVRYAVLVLLLAGVAFGVTRLTRLSFAWYLLLAALPLAGLAAHLKWRNIGYAPTENHFIAREGFWTRTTVVVPYYRVQTVIEAQTVFQRRRDLATVVVDTAGARGLTGGDPRALDIDAASAADLREELADRLQAALAERRQQRGRMRRQKTRDVGGVTDMSTGDTSPG